MPRTRCELTLGQDGEVVVQWRATFDSRSVRRAGLGFNARGARDVKCYGDRIASTVGHVGERVRIAVDFDAADEANQTCERGVTIAYRFRASDLGIGSDCYRLDSCALPRVLKTVPARHRKGPQISNAPSTYELDLTWDSTIQCYGPPRDPTLGREVAALKQPEWDDLEIQFGRFQRVSRGANAEIWLPQSEAQKWSRDDVKVVDTWFDKAWGFLCDTFGVPPRPITYVLLTGREGTLSQYLSNSNTIVVSYQHSKGAPWQDWAVVWLAMKLTHELSHAWWVPGTLAYDDDRVRSLVEAVAIVGEYTMPWRWLEEKVVGDVLGDRARRRASFLFRSSEQHRKLYGGAAAGLRTGYALSALTSDRRTLLDELRRLLDLMRSNDPKTARFGALAERACGPDLSQFLVDLLADPQPPVVRVRVVATSADERVVRLLFGTGEEAQRFAKRLRLSGLARDGLRGIDVSRRAVKLTFAHSYDPSFILGRLSPGFLLYRREIQEAAGAPLLVKLWKHFQTAATLPMPATLRDRLRRGALGLLAIAFYSESPIGYQLVGDALDHQFHWLAKRANDAAMTRTW